MLKIDIGLAYLTTVSVSTFIIVGGGELTVIPHTGMFQYFLRSTVFTNWFHILIGPNLKDSLKKIRTIKQRILVGS